MDIETLLLGIVTITLIGVAWHAARLGNERRDVVLLAVLGILSGIGTATTALI